MAAGVALVALAFPGPAAATINDVLGGEVACTIEGDGARFCGSTSPRSTVEAFDGVPIDVNVAFPPEPVSGPDGNYPLVMAFHGYGGSKLGLAALRRWVDRGYAAFTMTDRGFHESCGTAAAKAADPAGCAAGYVRLIDSRYEVRDAQEFAGMLADEGLIDPQRIGATGGSYGGGLSLALATLKDRMVMPDGTLVPWESPLGKPMGIAAATPFATWSDLAYSLAPNGSTLDYLADAPYQGRFGVMKQSLVSGLYLSGLTSEGFYAPEGADPSADLTGWRNLLLAGEPYDGDPGAEAMLDEITTNHSSYYIDSTEPPPLHLANVFTDDLFPVDEMVRYYNRVRSEYPNADISLFAADLATHPRGQDKPEMTQTLRKRQDDWLDYYLMGQGPKPKEGVEAYTQTCPEAAPAGGPYRASSWARLASGEIRVRGRAAKMIAVDGGSDAVAAAFNPISGPGACAETDAADLDGVATYRSRPAPDGGFTLLGSPTVTAEFHSPGANSQVAARLLDVAPGGTQRLVARGNWRPPVSGAKRGGSDRDVFQLHPNAYEFAAGHVAKLELLAADADTGVLGPYTRPSDGQQPIEVSDLELRLPVAAKPGSSKGFVGQPAPKLLGDGQELAADFADLPDPRARLVRGPIAVRGRKLVVKLACPMRFDSCNDGGIKVRKAGKGKRFRVAKGKFSADGGQKLKQGMRLTKRAMRYLRRRRGLKAKVKVSSAERVDTNVQRRRVRR